MKSTLRCHVHVRWSVHRGTASPSRQLITSAAVGQLKRPDSNYLYYKTVNELKNNIKSMNEKSVAVAWSVESLPVPGSIPGGVRNFNFCPGIGCVSFEFCPVLSSAEALTLC